jgi:hypothetical protein
MSARKSGKKKPSAARKSGRGSSADQFETIGARTRAAISPVRFSVAFAIRLRAAHRVEQNVEITKRGDDQRVVNTLSPAGFTLKSGGIVLVIDNQRDLGNYPGDCRSTHDRHVQQTRTIAGERA